MSSSAVPLMCFLRFIIIFHQFISVKVFIIFSKVLILYLDSKISELSRSSDIRDRRQLALVILGQLMESIWRECKRHRKHRIPIRQLFDFILVSKKKYQSLYMVGFVIKFTTFCIFSFFVYCSQAKTIQSQSTNKFFFIPLCE